MNKIPPFTFLNAPYIWYTCAFIQILWSSTFFPKLSCDGHLCICFDSFYLDLAWKYLISFLWLLSPRFYWCPGVGHHRKLLALTHLQLGSPWSNLCSIKEENQSINASFLFWAGWLWGAWHKGSSKYLISWTMQCYTAYLVKTRRRGWKLSLTASNRGHESHCYMNASMKNVIFTFTILLS